MKISEYRLKLGRICNPFFLITLITTIITVFLLEKQFFIGVPYYDVFVYLNNALIFAGIPVGNLSVIYLSPLMPFLTSLVFRAGYISENVIFILDGFIFILGVIGLYSLLNERFNSIKSFTGVLIFLSFPMTYAWAVSGGIDFPGISFSILTIYLLVLGVNKNSKYLYLVFPLLIVAFIARYTSAILIFPILLYLLLNKHDILTHLKKLIIGCLGGFAVITPFLLYIFYKLGNLDSLLNIFTSTLWGSGATVNDLGYNPVKLYFLNNLLNYVSVGPITGIYGILQSPSRGYPSILSYILTVIVLVGLGIYLYPILADKIKEYAWSKKTIIKAFIWAILSLLTIYSFLNLSYMITELLFLGVLYLSYNLINGKHDKNLKIDFLFLAWFGAFFIFHSTIQLKEDRYFITMMPALAYFIILGLSSLLEKFNFKNEHLKTALYLMVGLLFLSYSTVTYIGHVHQEGYGFYMQSACNWLKEYDPNYQDKVIYSNYDPAATWCLKKEVKFGVPRLYADLEAFSNYLIEGGADYYIDAYSTNPDIPGYHIIHNLETITIYERN